jgi:hypothetical protein
MTKENKMDKNGIVQEILGCAGVIINDNWIVYPSENNEGYEDSEWPIIEFYASDEDQDPIMEFSIDDLDNAKMNNGVLFVNDCKVQLLTYKPFDYRII